MSSRAERNGSCSRLALIPLSGGLIALCFVSAWLYVGRSFTDRVMMATLYLFVAGALSAAGSLVLLRRLVRRPWSCRYAAALFLMIAGPTALTSIFMAVQTGSHSLAIHEVPFSLGLLLAALIGAGALYGFLAVAGWLVLPVWLPLAAVLAAAMARNPCGAGSAAKFPQLQPRSR